MQDTSKTFTKLCALVERLRGPGGCPWDREQTPATLRGDLIEETFECVEAIDEGDPAHIREELGDLFLLLTMLSSMHEEAGLFSLSEVLEGIGEKIVRRHPHVFAGLEVHSSAEVLEHWARIKVAEEGRSPKDSPLDQVSRGLPPLDRAYRLQKEAAKSGFDWPDVEGVFHKVKEELGELREALAQEGEAAVEAELGDLLFSAVNLCRFLGVDPSVALQRTNAKFIGRFKYMEARMKEAGRALGRQNAALMESYWEEAKESSPAVS